MPDLEARHPAPAIGTPRAARLAALAFALAAALAPRAFAGNSDGSFIGNDAALAAGAVVARDGTGDAAWHDPAGLATLARDRVDVSATVFALRAQTLDNIIHSQLPDDSFASDLDSNELLVIPSTLIATYRFCDGVTGAIGFFTPHQDYLSSSSLVTSDLGDPGVGVDGQLALPMIVAEVGCEVVTLSAKLTVPGTRAAATRAVRFGCGE